MFNRTIKSFIFFAILFFCNACETISTEQQFETFQAQFEMEFEKHFPEGKYEMIDSLTQMPEKEALWDAEFCKESLKSLEKLTPDDFSKENKEKWLNSFKLIKSKLDEIQAFSENRKS